MNLTARPLKPRSLLAAAGAGATSLVLLIVAMVWLSQRAMRDEAQDSGGLGFQGDARHTGVYETRALRQSPQLKWLLMTGGPIRSSPLVKGSTLYVGSDDGYFRAVLAAS